MEYLQYVFIGIIIVWLIFREVAPKTKWDWDDTVLEVIEGLLEQGGYDPDKLARKSSRNLLRKKLQAKGKIKTPL